MQLQIDELKNVDNILSNYVSEIANISKSLELEENFQFQLRDEIPTEKWDSIVYPGVYLIEMKNSGKFSSFPEWIQDFQPSWEHEDYKRKFVPNLKKKRIGKHPSELREWIPLYIGKSKNVGKRILEHLYLKLNRNTFALKLYERQYLHLEYFKVSTIKIDVKNYDQIMPIVEKTLRDRINPIIGRQ